MPSSKQPISSDIVHCEKCGVQIVAFRLKRHLKHAHSPDKEAAAAARQLAEARNRKLTQVLVCPICKLKVRLSKMKSHFGSAHASPAPAEILQLLGESVGQNRFKSDREREAYWREKSGFLAEDESHDLFNKSKVLSGGAYGLGKNRKH